MPDASVDTLMQQVTVRSFIRRKCVVITARSINRRYLKAVSANGTRPHMKLKVLDCTMKFFGKGKNALSLVAGQQAVWIYGF